MSTAASRFESVAFPGSIRAPRRVIVTLRDPEKFALLLTEPLALLLLLEPLLLSESDCEPQELALPSRLPAGDACGGCSLSTELAGDRSREPRPVAAVYLLPANVKRFMNPLRLACDWVRDS